MIATQLLHSVLHPVLKPNNNRHSGHAAAMQYHTTPVPDVSELARDIQNISLGSEEADPEPQAFVEYARDGVGDETEFSSKDGIERAGVTHLVHAWYAQ